MARIVGVDCGEKRTGIAVSDPLNIFASPLVTLPSAKVVEFILKMMAEEGVSKLVVGYPKNLNNRDAEGAKYVTLFLKEIKQKAPEMVVILEDERFTSKIAFQSMIDGGVKKMGRRNKESVDKISAAIILQGYLDRISYEKNRLSENEK